MSPLYPTEPARVMLRRANKPLHHAMLSTTVAVVCAGQRCKAYVRYSDAMLEIVGHALPVGLGADHPALLRLVHVPATDTWRMYAMYVDRSAMAYLWKYDDCPSWLTLPKHMR